MIDSSTISHIHVEKHLDAMIFLVKEVDLVLQLLHVALISILLVLLCDLVHVLATLIELAQSQNFVVPNLDCFVESPLFLFNNQMSLYELFILVSHFVSSLIRTT